jgi:hypothetical protein
MCQVYIGKLRDAFEFAVGVRNRHGTKRMASDQQVRFAFGAGSSVGAGGDETAGDDEAVAGFDEADEAAAGLDKTGAGLDEATVGTVDRTEVGVPPYQGEVQEMADEQVGAETTQNLAQFVCKHFNRGFKVAMLLEQHEILHSSEFSNFSHLNLNL